MDYGILRAQATQLREMHHGPSILILPNAWDAASARVLERAGARAIATTSSGVSHALGYPDEEHLSREMMVAAVERIARAVSCPVSADMEAGYGDTIEAVQETIRTVIAAGAVGINIEDSRHRPERRLAEIAEQVELIQAIRQVADSLGVPLVINARTDVYLSDTVPEERRLDEAVRRANAYHAAGADCLFPIGASDGAAIGELARGISGPINILASARTPTIPELERLGVRRVTFGGGTLRAVLGHLDRIAHELLDEGSMVGLERDALPSAAFRNLF